MDENSLPPDLADRPRSQEGGVPVPFVCDHTDDFATVLHDRAGCADAGVVRVDNGLGGGLRVEVQRHAPEPRVGAGVPRRVERRQALGDLERRTLQDPRLPELMRRHGIELAGFGTLSAMQTA